MVRRSIILTVEVLGAVLAGMAIAVGLLAWRLSTGPIALEFLTPYVEAALTPADSPQRVEIAGTVLTWRGWGENPELRAENVTVRGADGQAVAEVPAVGLTFSLRALVAGVLAPARVALVRPSIRLVRRKDGTVALGVGGHAAGEIAGGATPEGSTAMLAWIEELSRPFHDQGSLGQLRAVSVRDGDVTVEDEVMGRSWRVPDGDIVFRRGTAGLEGTVGATVDMGDGTVRLEGRYAYDRISGRTALALDFSGVRPPTLAALTPAWQPLRQLDLPFAGEIQAALGPGLVLESAEIELRGGAGEVISEHLQNGAVEVTQVRGHARWEHGPRRLTVEDLWFDLDGASIAVSGRMTERDGEIHVVADLSVVDLPTERLAELWPPTVVRGGRRWVVANITEGGVSEAQIHLAVRMPVATAEPVVERIDGFYRFHGLQVRYLEGLPEVRNVRGEAEFDDKEMTLAIDGGDFQRATRVRPTVVRITEFQAKDQIVTVDVATEGPLREALDVLARPRLGFLQRFGLKPGDAQGDAEVRMTFAFPAINALRMDDVRVAGTARLNRVAVPAGIRDWRVTDGALSLSVDKTGMDVTGTARLQGVSVGIAWREVFTGGAPIPSRYRVRGRVDDAGRRAFGLDLGGLVTGPVDATLEFLDHAGPRAELVASMDLGPAAIALDALGWSKPAGAAGTASLAVDFDGDRMVRVRDLRVAAPGLAFEGAVPLADASPSAPAGAGPAIGPAIGAVEISALTLGQTRLTGRVRPIPGGWSASVSGPVFDATRFLDGKERPVPQAAGVAPPGPSPGPAPGAPPPSLAIEARFERILLGEGRDLSGATVSLRRDGARWREARVEGTVGRGAPIRLTLAPAGDGQERLSITSADAGAVLKALLGVDNIADGDLVLDGLLTQGAGGLGEGMGFAGRFDMRDYRLVRAPIVARILSVVSLPAVGSMLAGEGIPFTRAAAELALRDGMLTVTRGRAYGGAIGITAEGRVDIPRRTLDLEGTLVPAYTLNNLFGNIPVLGVLLGGRDEGLIATNFRVGGPLDDPRVSVNPLSTFAPGILRKVFGFLLEAGDPMREPAPPPSSSPSYSTN